MKKVISFTIDEEIWDFMEKTFVNKSAMLEALVRQYYIKLNINVPEIKEETEDKLEGAKEFEVFDAKGED
jgi:hypothetical protein